MLANKLTVLNETIIACRKCPRLVHYRENIARAKRRAYADWDYWGKPVPGFGDPHAQLLILGLAPAAHGANRTGRMFTGDRSGDFLYRALHTTGFANQATSVQRGDGLVLTNAYISAAVRCAPPDNKPLPTELQNCRPYLEAELDILKPKAILALGGLALTSYLRILKNRGAIRSHTEFPFCHGAVYRFPGDLPCIFTSYHPSQQNTFTGRLTNVMFTRVLRHIRDYLAMRTENTKWHPSKPL
ncbi:MAG TPA: uracil-DNA glycosylase [Candidatus Acidoferrales bacterium]|nr:uracil-DNA glycosylase [Candidatus Acidoferrales bacterium]